MKYAPINITHIGKHQVAYSTVKYLNYFVALYAALQNPREIEAQKIRCKLYFKFGEQSFY